MANTKKKLIKGYDKIADGYTTLKNIVYKFESDLTKEERIKLSKLLKEIEVPMDKLKSQIQLQ